MGFELVIFDLDGVLVDSTEAITSAFRRVLKERGAAAKNKEIAAMIGAPLSEMFSRYLPDAAGCVDAYRKIYAKTCVGGSRLYGGVAKTLECMDKRTLAVATTKFTAEAQILLKGLKIRKYFRFVLGIDKVKKPKPDPEIINAILRLSSVEKARSAFVGDTTYDILAGKAAGITTIAATYGFQGRALLESAHPDFFIDSFRELRGIVGN